jgi:phosphocarrier protein
VNSTIERQVTVVNRLGLHVRPAAQVAATAMQYRAEIRIARDGQEVDAKSSLDLLTLAAVEGVVLHVRAQGEDAAAAVEAVAGIIASGFGET